MGLSREPHLCQVKQNQKLFTKTKKVIDRGKRSKTLSEVKPVENIVFQRQVLCKKKSFFHINCNNMDAYEQQNSFGLKENNLSEKLPKSSLSSRFVSHRARRSGKFDSRKDLQSTKFKQRPRIFVKLSFRELHNLNLSGLHAFDNRVIIH